jgi:hypothetical protein
MSKLNVFGQTENFARLDDILSQGFSGASIQMLSIGSGTFVVTGHVAQSSDGVQFVELRDADNNARFERGTTLVRVTLTQS